MPSNIKDVEQAVDKLRRNPGHVTGPPIEGAYPSDPISGETSAPPHSYPPIVEKPMPVPQPDYQAIDEASYTTSSGVDPLPETPPAQQPRQYSQPIEEAYPAQANPYEDRSITEYPLEPGEEEPRRKRKLGTGEPVFLYIENAPGVFQLVGQFDSKIEARQEVDSNWTGATFKALTAREAIAEQQQAQARVERVQQRIAKVESGLNKAGSGLKRVYGNVTRNTAQDARARGMGPPPMRSSRQASPSNNDYVRTLQKFGQHMNQRFNPAAEGFNPPSSPMPSQQRRFNVQTPRSSFSFSPPASPIQGSRYTFVPPATPIRPSQHRLSPPVQSQRKYGVVPRHGQHLIDLPYAQQRQQTTTSGRGSFRVPLYRNPMLYRPGASASVQKPVVKKRQAPKKKAKGKRKK